MILRSPVTCPGCGHTFEGVWTDDKMTDDLECPACGKTAEQTWPGWDFETERIIESRG